MKVLTNKDLDEIKSEEQLNSVFESIRKEWTESHKQVNESQRDEIIHQGKTLDQWFKDFKGEFTKEQLLQMIRGEADLQKILMCGLDEAEAKQAKKDIDDPVFSGESFFDENEEVDPEIDEDEEVVNESIHPEDVVTVEDFILCLKSHVDLKDKIMFRANKEEYSLFDIHAKGGVAVLDFVKGKFNETETTESEADYVAEKEETKETEVTERYHGGYSDGGYGGTGKSYRRLSDNGDHVPRGAAIGWYDLEVLDPKAKGKAKPGWRGGPANFPFQDELYNNRYYQKFTMMLRRKVKDKFVQIAIPSYFDAVKHNDQVALDLLTKLGLPLNLTFGMDPNADYSDQYTETK